MRLLFLDIDGVLNGHEKHPDSPYTTIRPDCVQNLNRVVKATGCKIVVSSAWRYMLLHPKGNRRNRPAMQLLGFQYMLHTHGLMGCTKVVIGHTVSDEQIPERADQIREYVGRQHPEPLTGWAVVDDMDMDFGESQWRFVQTNEKKGLTDRKATELVLVLRRDA